jgi:hypothetical protein
MSWVASGEDYILMRDGVELARLVSSGPSGLWRVHHRGAVGKPSVLVIARQVAETLARFGG